MASTKKLKQVSNSASAAALIALIPIFLYIVTFGWQKIFAGVALFSGQEWLQYGFALCVAVIGVVLARMVAAERLRISLTEQAYARGIWVSYFFILLIISALGTMNSMFFWMQSQTVLADAFSSTNARLSELVLTVRRELSTPVYDGAERELASQTTQRRQEFAAFRIQVEKDRDVKREAIDSLSRAASNSWDKFESEMNNPLRPGWGQESRRRFEELRQVLPEMTVLSGSEGSFGNTPDAVRRSKQLLDEQRKSLATVLSRRIDAINNTCSFSDNAVRLYDDIRIKIQELPPLSRGSIKCDRMNDVLKELAQGFEVALSSVRIAPNPQELRRVDFKRRIESEVEQIIKSNERLTLNQESLSVEVGRPALEQSWRTYERIYTELADLAGTQVSLSIPRQIVIQEIRYIGQISNVVALFVRRWDKMETYIILSIAIIFDMILIAFYYRYLLGKVDDDHDDDFVFPTSNSNGSAPTLN